MPASDRRYWIGLDGEGLGREPHRYVLLARSDADGRRASIERRTGLRTGECLRWLLATPSDGRLAGYFLGYDWTMILRDLPNADIYTLLRPELRQRPLAEGGGFSPVRWRGYRLHYLSGMMHLSDGKGRGVTVWDLGRFFQAPFVDALEAWEIAAPQKMIARMKAKRSAFAWRDFAGIKRYCHAECKALAQLAAQLQAAHEAAGLKLRSWHGPGSSASVLLKRLRIDDRRGTIPSEVQDVASRAFFGGRFEQSRLGSVRAVIGYDIVSAYPYQAYQLPCLEHGRWEHVTRERDLARVEQACVRYELRDVGAEPWGPLPCRMPNGTILFPRKGSRGWVWLDEWRAAREGWMGVRWGGEAWALRTDCDCQPFEPLADLFRQRLALGKSGKGRVLKLALNSVYGKLAQTVGSPRFASRVWSGMITSGTRAQLLRLLCLHRDRRHVIALATDGLYSTERLKLPAAPLGELSLGSWEAEPHGTMVFVRPGIYWSEDGTVRARGVGRRHLLEQRQAVLDAIEGEDERALIGESQYFGAARACVYRLRSGVLRRSRHFGQWHDVPARISLRPAPKRRPDWSLPILQGVESAPYDEAPKSDDARGLQLLGDMLWGSRN